TLISQQKRKRTIKNLLEKSIPALLFSFAFISILTTTRIIYTLLTEAIEFFKRVPTSEFFTSTVLKPLSQQPEFGVLPLLTGTLMSTVIANFIDIPIVLMSAIYVGEFAAELIRKVVKPFMEILARIPMFVYGSFPLTFLTPFLSRVIPGLEATKIP